MKVVLIRYHEEEHLNPRLPPSINNARGAVPPLGLAYIASSLIEAGHEVKLVDCLAERISDEKLTQILYEFKPKVAGITTMTPTFRASLKAITLAKESGAITIVGGSHMSAFPKETMNHLDIDFGIIGEGEETFVKLLYCLENKKRINQIPGLVWRDLNKKDWSIEIKYKGFGLVKDLDTLPMAAHYLLPLDKYGTIISNGKIATMITSRGCPFRCNFCFKQQVDNIFRKRNPIKVVDEIEYLLGTGVKYIMFYDDTLTLDRKHIETICKEIISRGLKFTWEAPTRIDRVDRELLHLMKQAGCVRLRYGVESGNQSILNLMNKKITLDMVRDVFKWAKAENIESFAYFIIGYITETPETMWDTINFAKEIDADWVMFNVATPYPKTQLHDLAVQFGTIDKNYWIDFTLGKEVESIKPFVPDADKWVRNAYMSFYFRPKIILRELRKINSWKAFKTKLIALKGVFGV